MPLASQMVIYCHISICGKLSLFNLFRGVQIALLTLKGALLPEIYLETIWYDMDLELDVAMATIFWQACFAKFVIFLLLSKLFLSFCYFYNIDRFHVTSPLSKIQN